MIYIYRASGSITQIRFSPHLIIVIAQRRTA